MEEESKVAEVPVEIQEAKATENPETTEAESLIDNRRAEIEKMVITKNNTFPEPELVPEEAKPPVEEVKEIDPVERIKSAVQKRIDKVVAQKKSADEELAEARAEIARLKAGVTETPKETDPPKDDTPPTPEQVEAYIVKMAEEGNIKEQVAATRYLIKLEKELALKEVTEAQTKTAKEAEVQKAQQLADWTDLSKDYVAYDPDGKVDIKSDLNLSNQDGLLYKTALSLYNDKELHRDFYTDSNVIHGFRRAVADAYREIHQQGLISNTPKGEKIISEKKTLRASLADPSAVEAEDVSSQSNQTSLSDAEKVREDIKLRNKNRFKR